MQPPFQSWFLLLTSIQELCPFGSFCSSSCHLPGLFSLPSGKSHWRLFSQFPTEAASPSWPSYSSLRHASTTAQHSTAQALDRCLFNVSKSQAPTALDINDTGLTAALWSLWPPPLRNSHLLPSDKSHTLFQKQWDWLKGHVLELDSWVFCPWTIFLAIFFTFWDKIYYPRWLRICDPPASASWITQIPNLLIRPGNCLYLGKALREF